MTSPIHSFLFSPPPSPPLPRGGSETNETGAPYSPLRSLLPPAVRNSFDAATRPPKSPKLAQSGFILPPTSETLRAPSPSGNRSAKARGLKAIDVEAANLPTFKLRHHRLSPILSPRLMKTTTIPRPILRLLVFVALVLSGVMLLQAVTDALYPSAARIAAMEGGYVPPQAAASLHRSNRLVAPPPRTMRPHDHPLPESHELMALQSFIAESRYHFLRSDLDVSKPIDASDLIGESARRLGETGSAREKQWLSEVSDENSYNVVLWYASSSAPYYATDGLMARHGQGHRPTMISTADRPDGHVLRGIFARLGYDLDVAPVLVIGGEPIHATAEAMDELRSSGQLTDKLAAIGWRV